TPKMDLSIREWICLNSSCGKTHDRDQAASRNIRAEGIRILKTDGTAVSASGGTVRPDRGRKSKVRQDPANLETLTSEGVILGFPQDVDRPKRQLS
ncbi:MAG: hypothetical protein ACRC8K_11595, partial [Waterburya sp.]